MAFEMITEGSPSSGSHGSGKLETFGVPKSLPTYDTSMSLEGSETSPQPAVKSPIDTKTSTMTSPRKGSHPRKLLSPSPGTSETAETKTMLKQGSFVGKAHQRQSRRRIVLTRPPPKTKEDSTESPRKISLASPSEPPSAPKPKKDVLADLKILKSGEIPARDRFVSNYASALGERFPVALAVLKALFLKTELYLLVELHAADQWYDGCSLVVRYNKSIAARFGDSAPVHFRRSANELMKVNLYKYKKRVTIVEFVHVQGDKNLFYMWQEYFRYRLDTSMHSAKVLPPFMERETYGRKIAPAGSTITPGALSGGFTVQLDPTSSFKAAQAPLSQARSRVYAHMQLTILGKRGVGKSALANSLLLGNPHASLFEVGGKLDIDGKTKLERTVSMTFPKESQKLTVTDTPGLTEDDIRDILPKDKLDGCFLFVVCTGPIDSPSILRKVLSSIGPDAFSQKVYVIYNCKDLHEFTRAESTELAQKYYAHLREKVGCEPAGLIVMNVHAEGEESQWVLWETRDRMVGATATYSNGTKCIIASHYPHSEGAVEERFADSAIVAEDEVDEMTDDVLMDMREELRDEISQIKEPIVTESERAEASARLTLRLRECLTMVDRESRSLLERLLNDELPRVLFFNGEFDAAKVGIDAEMPPKEMRWVAFLVKLCMNACLQLDSMVLKATIDCVRTIFSFAVKDVVDQTMFASQEMGDVVAYLNKVFDTWAYQFVEGKQQKAELFGRRILPSQTIATGVRDGLNVVSDFSPNAKKRVDDMNRRLREVRDVFEKERKSFSEYAAKNSQASSRGKSTKK